MTPKAKQYQCKNSLPGYTREMSSYDDILGRLYDVAQIGHAYFSHQDETYDEISPDRE
jgi:hypothetical protein